MNTYSRMIALSCGLAFGATGMTLAQDSTNRVFQETAWSVFVEDAPTQCWLVSEPTETVNTKEGRVVSVTRGDILLFISYWPDAGKKGEVSFAGGYPFKDGSTVKMDIGGSNFELFVTGETAWALTPEDDQKIVSAMKRGAQATLTGESSRGTVTKDSFSLLGFTASVADAEKRCS